MVTHSWAPAKRLSKAALTSGTGYRMVTKPTGARVPIGPDALRLTLFSGAIFVAASYEKPIAGACGALHCHEAF